MASLTDCLTRAGIDPNGPEGQEFFRRAEQVGGAEANERALTAMIQEAQAERDGIVEQIDAQLQPEDREKFFKEEEVAEKPEAPPAPTGPRTAEEIAEGIEDIDTLLDEAEKEAGGPTAAPGRQKPYGPKGKGTPAAEAPTERAPSLGEAKKKATEAFTEGLKGMEELFGGPGGLGAGPIKGLNKETYERAKPHFKKSLEASIAAGQEVKAWAVMWIKELKKRGLDNARAYLDAFLREMQGAPPVFEEPAVEEAPSTEEEVVETTGGKEAVEEPAEAPPTEEVPAPEPEGPVEEETEVVEEETAEKEETGTEEAPAEEPAEKGGEEVPFAISREPGDTEREEYESLFRAHATWRDALKALKGTTNPNYPDVANYAVRRVQKLSKDFGFDGPKEWFHSIVEDITGKFEQSGETWDPLKRKMDQDTDGPTPGGIKKVLGRATRASAFSPKYRPTASPGTKRWMKTFRDEVFTHFAEWFGNRHASSRMTTHNDYKAAILKWADGNVERFELLKTEAAKYIAALDFLGKTMQSATTVQEAADAAKRVIFEKYEEVEEDRGFGNTFIKFDYKASEYAESHPYVRTPPRFFSTTRLARFIEQENDILPGDVEYAFLRNNEPVRDNLPDWREGKLITNVDPDNEFQTKLGLKGVDFGEKNYMNDRERARVIQLAYDAFRDWAMLLGAEGKDYKNAASLFKKLEMHFGNLGSLNSHAAAFYMPGKVIINLTKGNGDGSLGHELAHGLDETAQVRGDDRTKLARDGLIEAFQTNYDWEAGKALLEEALDPDSYFNTSYTYKGVKGLEKVKQIINDNYKNYVKKSSLFLRESEKAKNHAYQSDEAEMWARAFQAWLYDTLKTMGGENNYLSNAYASEGFVSPENGYTGTIYPKGLERTFFNDLIQDFVEGIDWSGEKIAMKDGYITAVEKIQNKYNEELQKTLDSIEEAWNAKYGVVQSEDGLYWYAYTITKRGQMMQPRGFAAYNDNYRLEEGAHGGEGAIGYNEPLNPDHAMDFKLRPIKHEKSEDTKYIKTKEEADESFSSGPAGGATLETGEARHGGEAGEGGGTTAGPGLLSGEGRDGVQGVDSTETTGTASEGDSDEAVDTSPVGEGDAGPAAGPDAISSHENFVIEDAESLGKRTLPDRFNDNVAALRLLKLIEEEGRQATNLEKQTLVRYSGWGGLGETLNPHNTQEGWQARREILESVLTPEEMDSLRESSTTAYYTPPAIYQAIWEFLEGLGFQGGKILAPAAGIGHEIGTMPTPMRPGSSITAIEPEPFGNRILSFLYPKTAVHNDRLEQIKLPEGFFDVVISNVPFSGVAPADITHNPEKFNLHDYFFRRAIRHAAPGGVIAMLTSTTTMDGATNIRTAIEKDGGQLLGAFRLPEKMFSGTDVNADLIIIRKKGGAAIDGQKWAAVQDREIDGFTLPLNEYFVDNPEHLMGIPVAKRTQWGRTLGVKSTDGEDRPIGVQLRDVLGNLSHYAGIMARDRVDKERGDLTVEDLTPAPGETGVNQFYDKDGDLYFNNEGYEEKFTGTKKNADIIRRSMKLRDVLRELNRAMLNDEADATIQSLQAKLTVEYDAFIKKNKMTLTAAITDKNFLWDMDAPSVLALEELGTDGSVIGKAAVFTKRTLRAFKIPTHASNAEEALTFSLGFRGRVDMDYMKQLTGKTHEDLLAELKGLVFVDPDGDIIVSKEEYLSGNVREKLDNAKLAAEVDKKYEENVKALETVQPEPLGIDKIAPRLGASWVQPEHVRGFVKHIMEKIPSSIVRETSVEFQPHLAKWYVRHRPGYQAGYGNNAITEMKKLLANQRSMNNKWGTLHMPFHELLPRMLNGQTIQVMYTDTRGGRTRRVVDERETTMAMEKAEALQAEFHKWIKSDVDRTTAVVERYNEIYNVYRLREFDGSHLMFPGQSPTINLYPHQRRAVWRWISTGNTYLAHEVGTGKTWGMSAIAMEAKRLGLRKRPLIVTHPENSVQFLREFKELYPQGRVLQIKLGDKAEVTRRKLATIKTADYDIIMVDHNTFERMPLAPETVQTYINEDIAELRQALDAANAENAGEKTVKDINEQIKKFEARLEEQKQLAEKNVLKGVSWEELGIDLMLVDEAHRYKNISYATARGRVRGINPNGSTIGDALFWKTRFMNERYPGGVVMASGTPLTNSVAELYNIQRLMQFDEMKRRNIQHFDSWVGSFGVIENVPEYDPRGNGGFRSVEKFSKFVNVPELIKMAWTVMDVATADQAGVKRPQLHGGKAENVVISQSEAVAAYMRTIVARANEQSDNPFSPMLKKKYPDEPEKWGATYGLYPTAEEDPKFAAKAKNAEKVGMPIPDMLMRLVIDGKKAAIDPRLVLPGAGEDKNSKIYQAAQRIFKHYHNPPEWSTKPTPLPRSKRKAEGGEKRRPPRSPESAGELERERRYGPRSRLSQGLPLGEQQPEFQRPFKGVQLVFADLGAPTGAIKKTKVTADEYGEMDDLQKAMYDGVADQGTSFNVYDGLKNKLIEMGIPENEIAFIHDYKASNKQSKRHAKLQKELQDKVRSGKIRVLIGSTETMGTGKNFQDMLVAAHHLDVWWQVSAYNQRNGRIWRQGNKFKEIFIYNYVTEDTIDAFVWDKVASKAKILDAFMAGNLSLREIDDIGEEVMNLMQVAALASGNKEQLEILKLQKRENILAQTEVMWQEERRIAKENLDALPLELDRAQEVLSRAQQDLESLEEINAIKFHNVDRIFRLKAHGKEIALTLEGEFDGIEWPTKGTSEIFAIADFYKAVEKVEKGEDGKEKKTYDFQPTDAHLHLRKALFGDAAKRPATVMSITGLRTAAEHKYTWRDANDLVAKESGGQLSLGKTAGDAKIQKSGTVGQAIGAAKSLANANIKDKTKVIDKLEKSKPDLEAKVEATFEQAEELDDVRQRLQKLFAKAMGEDASNPRNGTTMENYQWFRAFTEDKATFKWGERNGVWVNNHWIGGDAAMVIEGPVWERRRNKSLRAINKVARSGTSHNDIYREWIRNVKGGHIRYTAKPSWQKGLELGETGQAVPMAYWETENDGAYVFFDADKVVRRQDIDFVYFVHEADIEGEIEWWRYDKDVGGNNSYVIATDSATKEPLAMLRLGNIHDITQQEKPERIDKIVQGVKDGSHVPKGITSLGFMGVNPEVMLQLVGSVKKLAAGSKVAYDRLVQTGQAVYDQGHHTFKTFRAEMRKLLGSAWNKFKGMMVKVFETVKRFNKNLGARGSMTMGPGGRDSDTSGRQYDQPSERHIEDEEIPVEEGETEPEFVFVGRRMDQPETPHPLTDPETPGNPLTDHVKKAKGPLRALLNKFYLHVPKADMNKWKELFGLPYWIAKEHPEFRRIMDIELRRDEERMSLQEALLKSPTQKRSGQIAEIMQLPLKEAEELAKFLVKSDAQQKLFKKKVLVRAGLNEQQIVAYYAWFRSMKRAWDVKFAYTEYMIYMPYAHYNWMTWNQRKHKNGKPVKGPLETLPVSDLQRVTEGLMTESEALAKISDSKDRDAFKKALARVKAPATKLKEHRKQWRKVKFYFPRVREQGDIFIQVWKDDSLVESHQAFNGVEAKRYYDRMVKKYGKEFVRYRRRPKTPESMYGDLNDAAIERFINKAISDLEAGNKIDEKQAEELRDTIFREIAQELNVRGFLQRAQRRLEGKPVKGYQETNVQDLFTSYMGGLSGFVTKQKAAFEFYQGLSGIGIDMKTKTDRKTGKSRNVPEMTRPQLFEYARQYVKDMLQNQERIDQWSATFRAGAFFWFLAGNLKSAAVNLTQNFVAGVPILSRYTKNANAKYLKAIKDVVASEFGGKDALEPEVRRGLQEAIEKGVTTDQYLREITGRLNSFGGAFDKMVRVLGKPFSWAEIMNRKFAFVAMYRVQSEAGKTHGEAFRMARDYVYDVHFLYGKANLPTWARGKGGAPRVARTAYTFRSFNHNYLLAMRHFMTVDKGTSPEKLARLDVLLKSMAFLVLLGGVGSIPFMDDLLEMFERMFGVPIRSKARKQLQDVAPVLDRFGTAGIPGMLGFDLGGSLRMGLPANPLAGGLDDTVFGVYGGLLSRMTDAMTSAERRDWDRALEYGLPMFASNVIRAVREGTEGASFPTGKRKYDEKGKPLKLSPYEAVGRAVGFRPVRDTIATDEQRSFYLLKGKYDNIRTDLYARLRMARGSDRAKVRKDIQKYNREVLKFKGAIPRITQQSMTRALRDKPNVYYDRFQRTQ